MRPSRTSFLCSLAVASLLTPGCVDGAEDPGDVATVLGGFPAASADNKADQGAAVQAWEVTEDGDATTVAGTNGHGQTAFLATVSTDAKGFTIVTFGAPVQCDVHLDLANGMITETTCEEDAVSDLEALGADLLGDLMAAELAGDPSGGKSDLADVASIACPIAIAGIAAVGTAVTIATGVGAMFGVAIYSALTNWAVWGAGLATMGGCGYLFFTDPPLTNCVQGCPSADAVCLSACTEEASDGLDNAEDRHEALGACVTGCSPGDGTCVDLCVAAFSPEDG